MSSRPLTKSDFETLSEFRFQIRRFERFSEDAALAEGIVALVTRCEAIGLVKRRPSPVDGRQVEVHLLANGERILEHLAGLHRDELNSISSRARWVSAMTSSATCC